MAVTAGTGRGSFSAQVSRFCFGSKRKADEVLRRSVVTLATKIILRSPVDTGLFRGNWQLRVGAPVRGSLTTLDPFGTTAIARIAKAMQSDDAPIGKVFYLGNTLPYGHRLEFEGWSKQAPNGMVGISVKEFPQDVAAIVKAIK